MGTQRACLHDSRGNCHSGLLLSWEKVHFSEIHGKGVLLEQATYPSWGIGQAKRAAKNKKKHYPAFLFYPNPK